MIVAGLTGSIAMGKSETAKMFVGRGIPVFDSDAAVHALYAKGGDAVPAVERIDSSVIMDGAVDRGRLAARILERPGLLKDIEAVVHPLVRARQERFLSEAALSGARLAILDIPLLFETGREKDVDIVMVVSAPPELQKTRALARSGMTEQKLDFILSKQVPDDLKRARADYLIDTSVSFEDTARQVENIIKKLLQERN